MASAPRRADALKRMRDSGASHAPRGAQFGSIRRCNTEPRLRSPESRQRKSPHAEATARSGRRRRAPTASVPTGYDEEHLITYLRLLDAETDGPTGKWLRASCCTSIPIAGRIGRAAPGQPVWVAPAGWPSTAIAICFVAGRRIRTGRRTWRMFPQRGPWHCARIRTARRSRVLLGVMA